MFRVLFTGCPMDEIEITELRNEGLEIKAAKGDLSEDELIYELTGMDAYVCGGDELVTPRVLEAMKNVRLYAFYGTDYRRFIDVKAAREKGIVVTNTPGANAASVAEFTVALILAAHKRLVSLNNATKQGSWEKNESWLLNGKTVGIIGMGNIGSRVARILHNGFGMNILYFNKSRKEEYENELAAKQVDLQALLKESDVISLSVPLIDELKGFISAKELDMVKPGLILVNAARAELVDGHALYQALVDNKLAIAAFDGYYVEPVPSPEKDEHKLMSLPDSKFILTPHTAFNSKDAVKTMTDMCIRQVLAVSKAETPENVVN